MTNNILKDLYFGRIHPAGIGQYSLEHFCRKNPAYLASGKLQARNRDRLLAQLNEKGKETLENYDAAGREMADIAEYAHFTYGFKLGMLLVAAGFQGMEHINENESY